MSKNSIIQFPQFSQNPIKLKQNPTQRLSSQPCRFVVVQGGNVHLVRSAAVATEMEFATRWCGNDGALLWLCARKKNSRFDGGRWWRNKVRADAASLLLWWWCVTVQIWLQWCGTRTKKMVNCGGVAVGRRWAWALVQVT